MKLMLGSRAARGFLNDLTPLADHRRNDPGCRRGLCNADVPGMASPAAIRVRGTMMFVNLLGNGRGPLHADEADQHAHTERNAQEWPLMLFRRHHELD